MIEIKESGKLIEQVIGLLLGNNMKLPAEETVEKYPYLRYDM